MRPKEWRVRVKRAIEDSVTVVAETAAAAEVEAAKLPGVISVFGRSAIPGDQLAGREIAAGVEE